MPTATLSLPDGSTVTVQYPEGTSEQELIDYVKKQYNQKKLPSKTEPKDEASGSLGRTASALGAEVAIAEGAKYAGAAAGGALGSAVPVVGTAIGAGTGYVIGAISGGITGSLAAQEIENPDGDISWGRVVSDTLLNFIPGSKIAKGGKFATRVGKAALANAAIGAGAAPAAQLIEGSIEGRLPTQEELIRAGITGTLLGGALGAGGETLSRSYAKFAGKNQDELTKAYNRGDKDAKNVVDPLLNAADPEKAVSQVATNTLAKGDIVENFPKSAKGLVGLAKRTVSRIAPSAGIGRELDLDLERIRKEADGLEATADKIRSTIESKLKRDPSAKDKIDQFLTGQADLDSSLNDIAADLRKFKDEMAPVQEELAQLIDADFYRALDSKERERLSNTIRQSIKENKYLKREYRIFTDKNFVRSPAQRRKAQEEIADSIIKKNREEISEAIKNKKEVPSRIGKESAMVQAGEHLKSLENASARSQKNKEVGYVPQSFQGSLKKLREPGEQEKLYLGEIKDPSEKVFGTLSGTARLRQAAKEDQAILDYVQRSGVGVRLRPGEMVPEDLEKLNLKTIDDSNIYVPIEFEIALEKVRPRVAKQRDNFNKTWDSISGFVKAKNVLGNAPAYATQLVSGIGLTLSNGIMPRGRYFKNVGRGTQVVAGDFKALSKIPGIQRVLGDRKAFLDDYQDAVSLGIINQNVEASDIRNAFEGSFKPLKKIIDPLGKVYSAPDSTYRYALWKSNQDSISKMFPGLDEQSAKRLAANFTNDTFPNYERVSGAAKFLSRKAAINPYISFTLETFRNVYNQVKYADQMLKGEFGRNLGIDPSKLTKADQAAMRLEGLKRLGAVIGVVGGSTAAATGAVNVFKGKDETTLETDEEKQAYQETIANSWDRGKTLVATMNEDRSKSRYADPSYLVPQAIIRDAIKAGLSGDPDAITKYVVDQFGTDGGLVVRPLLNAIANKDDFGNILESQEDYGAEERAMYLFKELLTPPTLREAKKWEEALEGKGKYDVGDLTKRAFGLRVNAVDNKQQARFNIMDSVKNLQETKRRFYKDAEELQDADLQAAYQRSNAQAKQSYDKIAKHYKNLQTLGFSENEIFTIMKKEAGVSSKDLLRISSGLGYENFEATKAKNIRELYEDLDPEISKDRAIRAIEDPEIRRRLENYQKEQEFIEKKNISIRERTLMGLTNIEKVQYLKNNNASRGEIIDLWKRKVISGKVRAEALRNSRR
tara:strand:- start:6198 stop:9881 length:3684 start_codon:yes stop_codon:yes gene_type:complete